MTTQTQFAPGQKVWYATWGAGTAAAVVEDVIEGEDGPTGQYTLTLETPEYEGDAGARWAYADQLTPRYC